MSKLTTEKFLLNKQGVRMFFFREDGLTPKQLEIMAKPVTKENRQDLEKTFDTSPSLGDNNGQPPNGGDKTNLAAPSPEDPNGPKSQEQTPVSGEKEQVEMRRTIEELRSQTTPSPEALKALQEAGITQKEARQEIGQEAATNMPKAKEARGIWSKMKQGLSDKWNNLGPNNTVRIAKLIAILALSGVTSVAGATLFLGISGTIAGAPLVTAGAIGSYTAIPFIGPALATSTPLFAGLATTAITAASAASVWGINKLFSKPKESKAGQAQQPQPEAQRNPETINENLEPKLIVALNIINNSPTPVSFNLDGQKYYIQFKNGQYLLTTPQQQDPRVLTEDVVKQSLSAQPEVVDQIVETGINKTQEYLNQVESTQNTSYLVFQLGDDKQLKVPVTFNQSPLEFSNTLNKLRELGLNINPSLLGSDETTSISSGFQPGKEYGQFIFKELETPQQAQQPEAEQQSPAVEEEKTPKARVDNALDTLATLPQNKATFEYKGRNITVENNEGNITVAVDDQPLDAKTFINALYKTPEAVEALEKAVQELQAQPSDSEQNPQNPEEPARTLDDLLNKPKTESNRSTTETNKNTAPTETITTAETKEQENTFGKLNTIEATKGYASLKTEVEQIRNNNSFQKQLEDFYKNLLVIAGSEEERNKMLIKALDLQPDATGDEIQQIMETAAALSGMENLPEYAIEAKDNLGPKASSDLINEYAKDTSDPTKIEALKSSVLPLREVMEHRNLAIFTQSVERFQDYFKYDENGLNTQQTLENILNAKNEEPVASMLQIIEQEEGGQKIAELIRVSTPEQISNILRNPENQEQKLQLHQAISKMAEMAGIKYEVPQTVIYQAEVESYYDKLDTEKDVTEYLLKNRGKDVWMKLKGSDNFEKVTPIFNTGIVGGVETIYNFKVNLKSQDRKLTPNDVVIAVEPAKS